MTEHVHAMVLTADIPLSLPDDRNMLEKVITYECTGCSFYSTITGYFHVGAPHRFEFLVQRAQQERHERSPFADVVRQNETLLKRRQRLEGLA